MIQVFKGSECYVSIYLSQLFPFLTLYGMKKEPIEQNLIFNLGATIPSLNTGSGTSTL